MAKNASIEYGGVRVNIIDTPGHADFGGEVERVLNMADGCLLLIDAVEGPMPQTKFVLRKALEIGLHAIVVVNKIDRPNSRIDEVIHETSDLFLDLATKDHQLDFPVLYANARDGYAGMTRASPRHMQPLLDAIIEHTPPPLCDPEAPFRMLATTLAYDSYRGRTAVGRITDGAVHPGETRHPLQPRGRDHRSTASPSCSGSRGSAASNSRKHAPATSSPSRASATSSSARHSPLRRSRNHCPSITIEEPAMKMTFRVNDSPFAGREGQFVTSRQMRERLFREVETNVALRVEDGDTADAVRGQRAWRAAPRHPRRDDAPRRLRVRGDAARGHRPRTGRTVGKSPSSASTWKRRTPRPGSSLRRFRGARH